MSKHLIPRTLSNVAYDLKKKTVETACEILYFFGLTLEKVEKYNKKIEQERRRKP